MPSKLSICVAAIAALGTGANAVPAGAQGDPRMAPEFVGPPPGPTPGPRVRRHRHHAPVLPPEVRYRDPRVVRMPPSRGPDFLIHAYLPRYTDVPMYNEPPARFPQR